MKEHDTKPNILKSIQERLNDFLTIDKGKKPIMDEKPTLIKTGITTLDAILGGGIILGGFIQLVGRAGCGKSSLAAKFVSSFQKYSDGKCIALYIDSETTMSKYRLSQLGINNPSINPISDVLLEDIFEIIDAVIQFKKDNKDAADIPAIIVWDSIASTLCKKEFAAEDPKEVIGFKARLLSLYLPRITSALQEYKITIVAINQLRDNVGISVTPTPVAIKGMKQTDVIPGGRTLQFATSQLIYMSDVGNLEEKIYGFDGKEVELYCIKNKAFPPLIKTKTCFSYMGGYSNFWSAFSILKEEKIIITTGAWYSIPGYDKKFQGSKVANLYTTDILFRNAFDNALKMYTDKVIEKYNSQLESCNIDDVIVGKIKSSKPIAENMQKDANQLQDSSVSIELNQNTDIAQSIPEQQIIDIEISSTSENELFEKVDDINIVNISSDDLIV